jgi:hypothetical protein
VVSLSPTEPIAEGIGVRRINRTPPAGREAASAGFLDLWNKEVLLKV